MNYTDSKGTTLVISMILLTTITFLAMLGMQQSSVQLRMINNTQIAEVIFQVSMSELESKYEKISSDSSETSMLAQAINSVLQQEEEAVIDPDTLLPIYEAISVTPEANYYDTYQYNTDTQVQYQGNGNNLNYSLSVGSSVGRFTSHPFHISSNSTDQSERFNSTQTMGMTFIASTGR